MLSHILATRGVRVTLLERQSDFSREFRGEALAPSGIAVLQSLEIDAVLEKVPHSTPSSFELYVNRQRVFRIDVEADMFSDLQPRIYSQPALLEAIIGSNSSGAILVPTFR